MLIMENPNGQTRISRLFSIFSLQMPLLVKPLFLKSPHSKILTGETRKIVIIGDSFSDQIVYALAQALPDNELVTWLADTLRQLYFTPNRWDGRQGNRYRLRCNRVTHCLKF